MWRLCAGVCVCGFVRDVSISIKTIERPAKEEGEGEEERGIEKNQFFAVPCDYQPL